MSFSTLPDENAERSRDAARSGRRIGYCDQALEGIAAVAAIAAAVDAAGTTPSTSTASTPIGTSAETGCPVIGSVREAAAIPAVGTSA